MHLRARTRLTGVCQVPKLCTDVEPVICGKVAAMADADEVEALKASMRGVRHAAAALSELSIRVEALDARSDLPDADLADLQRLSLANAVAAQALRGLVQTMMKRRGKVVEEAVSRSTGEDEER
jgi:hypothetical protein